MSLEIPYEVDVELPPLIVLPVIFGEHLSLLEIPIDKVPVPPLIVLFFNRWRAAIYIANTI